MALLNRKSAVAFFIWTGVMVLVFVVSYYVFPSVYLSKSLNIRVSVIVYYAAVVIWLMGIGIYGLWKIIEAKIEAKSKAKSLEVRKQLAHKYRMGYSLRNIERRKIKLLLRAVEQSANGIAVFNLDGIVLFANNSWAKQHGYALEEVIGKHLCMFHADEQATKLLEGTKEITSGELFFGEIWCIRKDRSTFPALTTASLLKNHLGEPYAILEVIQDISELKQTQKALQIQIAKALEFSRLKSNFLSVTLHELRVILSSIIGFSRSIVHDIKENKKEGKRRIANIYDSAQHLLKLIDQILDIARIEAGKTELKLEELDLKKIFNEIHNLTYVQVQEKGMVLSFNIDENSVPKVYADKDKLKQVLLNLIVNALNFNDKGKISVSALPTETECFVRIEIKDTGISISPQDQKNIFERSVQGDDSHSRNYGGVGLGLTISKKLIEMMGGSIDIYSPGTGQRTRVSFILPAISTFHI